MKVDGIRLRRLRRQQKIRTCRLPMHIIICIREPRHRNQRFQTKNRLVRNRDPGTNQALRSDLQLYLVWQQESNDLAVIAVAKADIPQDTLSEIKIAQLDISDDLEVGEQVVAIGNALGYGQSVTSGWISALNRTISTDDMTGSGLIQTDAAINPGNSGGALLNMKGEVIGINSAKFASNAVEGMGYAIPISKAQPILEDLMSRETRDKVDSSEASYLGINPLDLSAEVTAMFDMPEGVFVSSVNTGEAADNAGIRKGDIITGFDGQTVTGRDDLNDKMKYYAAGETVDITIARAQNGQYMEQTVQVTLGSRPSAD